MQRIGLGGYVWRWILFYNVETLQDGSGKTNMEQAKYDLRNFSRELNDVNVACNLNINTGDFLSFADYFLMDLWWTGWSRIESILQKDR